ncbi:MAG: carboxyl transferase [Lachnospiraceae bacterium]|nr:carboxyl transferase [Lachnospiraceae bacterium]
MSNTSNAGTRISSLLDENSFVEIGALVRARATDFNLNPKAADSDGVITGYGLINDRVVYVYSQDPSVLAGSVGEMHAKKILRLYDLAMKAGAPVIGLIDSAGLRLQEGADALDAFGKIYKAMSDASGVIPQITAVFGECGGGLAVLSAMSDIMVMEKGAKVFVNSPNALSGNYEAKKDTASSDFVSSETGICDLVCDEASIYDALRKVVGLLPDNNEDSASYDECDDDLNRETDDFADCITDASVALARIADDQDFTELKAGYARQMVTGLLKLNGLTVGAVANRTAVFSDDGKESEKFDPAITAEGAEKAADFVEFCDAFNIPVLTLVNASGFEATTESEKKMAKAVAKLTYSFANATVPKVNLITGKAFGSAYVAMNSSGLGADLTLALKGASVGMMDASLAAKIMYASEDASVQKEKASEYDKLQNSVDSAAARGYVDQIIDGADARKYLIAAFEMLYSKREDRPYKKHGTV